MAHSHLRGRRGGFIGPFIYPDLIWDFRLPLVKSINVSGHKCGLVDAGIGWVVWRNKEDLPEELIFQVHYLGADQPTFTLTFSEGASQVIAQYYQRIRLGFDRYRNIMANCAMNAKILTGAIESLGRFKKISEEIGVPVVAFSLLDNQRRTAKVWMDSACLHYAQHATLLRVMVRKDSKRSLADRLVTDIKHVLAHMDARSRKLIQSVTEAVQQENLEARCTRRARNRLLQ